MRPDLLLGFNGNLSNYAHVARLDSILARRVVRECFGRVGAESAYLSGGEDTYDKQRRHANWTVGPNNLFVHSLEAAARRGYRYMAQLEPDVLPLRSLWLDRIQSLAASSSAWVLGSPFLGQCARDAHSERCMELGDEIKFHMNGNALYAVGDAAFRAYWSRAFAGQLSLWPFDLALHLHTRSLPIAAQRRLTAKFRAQPFILNFGGEPLLSGATAAAAAVAIDEENENESEEAREVSAEIAAATVDNAGAIQLVCRSSRHTYLLHSSWVMRQLRARGAVANTALAPQCTTRQPSKWFVAGTTEVAASRDDDSGLVSLARRISDADGRLILTFATAVYDPLCRDFVAHLRHLGVRSYLIGTFTRSYHKVLTARGERPHLHNLPQLTSGGSDVFGSHDFFLLNSARYAVLTRLLRAGLHVFSCDLDVALLRNPLPIVWRHPHDLLLQSDARDASTLTEMSPFLLFDRLKLPRGTPSVTYVNGGVFFARGTHAVARLFEDTWAMASQDIGRLNEQDCLNRVLLDSALQWSPLSPRFFPNGYVSFRRPLPPLAEQVGGGADPATDGFARVLIHCNWINGIAAKRFLMREALVWTGDDRKQGSKGAAADEKYLAYAVGSAAGERTLGGQVRAFTAALALAAVSNRTLVLPNFHALPGREDDGGRRVFTYLFEYSPMLQYFPDNRESSLLRELFGKRGVPRAQVLPNGLVATREAAAAKDTAELLQWLKERHNESLLHVRGLYRKTVRSFFVCAPPLAAFESKLRMALQPAPELRVISHHIITRIRIHLHKSYARRRHAGRGGHGGRQLLGLRGVPHDAPVLFLHDFNCLHVSEAELRPNRLKAAARSLPPVVPTLLVRELRGTALREASDATGNDASNRLRAPLPPAASTIFTEALHVGEFFPYWDEVEIFDVNGVCTLAFNLIEQLVCSAARRVHGNADSDFIHGVCHWRWGSMISSPFGTASGRGLRSAHDVCSVLRYPCHSL